MRITISEDRYLLVGAAVMIVAPFLMAGYVYYFLSTTYAQQRSVEASQNWVRVLDAKPGTKIAD